MNIIIESPAGHCRAFLFHNKEGIKIRISRNTFTNLTFILKWELTIRN